MKSKVILLTILLLGLTIRVPFLFLTWNAPLRIVDEQHYNGMAQYFAKTGNVGAEGHLSSIRPPMYIWFVSGFYKICGLENVATAQLAVRIFQIAISLLTVYMVYRIGIQVFDKEETALIGAGLFCFYPSMIMQNFMILTETLFTFFLVMTIYHTIQLFPKQRNSFNIVMALVNASACGLFLGFGALTRSILWLAIPCVFLFLLLFVNAKWTIRFGAATTTFLVASVVIAPWVIRNTRLQQTPTAIDCMSGRNLMMGNYEYTPLYRAWDAIHIEGEHNWYSVLSSRYDNVDPLTQGQKDKLAGKYAKEFMLAHPGLTLQRFCVKALCFWQLERSVAALFAHGDVPMLNSENSKLATYVVALVFMLYYAVIFILATFGVFFAPPKQWKIHLLFLCIAALFWGVHSIVFAHSRYHLPLTPLLCLYAASYISYIIQYGFGFSRNQLPRLIVCLLIVVTFTGFWTWETLWYLS